MCMEKIKTIYNLEQRKYKLRSTDWAVMWIFSRSLYNYGLSLLMNRCVPVMVAMYLRVHIMPRWWPCTFIDDHSPVVDYNSLHCDLFITAVNL